MMDMPLRSNNKDESVRTAFRDLRALIDTDPESAKAGLSELADAGCAEAMVCLGVMCADGDEKDKEMVPGLFRRASELGDSSGTRNMGYIYALGLCVEQDKNVAAEWYKRAALEGNPRAQCNIGVLYRYRNGVPQDLAEAAKWYSMSAANGYSRGQTNLGILMLEGKGIEKDPVTAARLFMESGSPRAHFRLATQYLEGNGVRPDNKKAMELLDESHSRGYAKASALLAKLMEDIDKDRALELYMHAASNGDPDAAEWLSLNGFTIPERIPRKRRRRTDTAQKG